MWSVAQSSGSQEASRLCRRVWQSVISLGWLSVIIRNDYLELMSKDAAATDRLQALLMAAGKPTLPEEVLKVIHGHVEHEEKKQQYQESLQKWVHAWAGWGVEPQLLLQVQFRRKLCAGAAWSLEQWCLAQHAPDSIRSWLCMRVKAILGCTAAVGDTLMPDTPLLSCVVCVPCLQVVEGLQPPQE